MSVSISPRQLGERLAWARKKANLTQAEVATQVGLARTTLVAMEKGERKPSNAELIAIARTVGVQLGDLLRAGLVRTSAAPRLRTGMSEDDVGAIMQIVERLRELGGWYVELERLHGIQRATAPLALVHTYRRAPGASEQEPRQEGEDAARSVRAILGLGDDAALALDERLEAGAGLRTFCLDRFPASIAACAIWSDEVGPCIAIHRDLSRPRRRWSLAQELGHFLRVHDGGHVLEIEAPARREDVFADAFARELLLPATGVQRRFAELCRIGRFTAVQLHGLSRAFDTTLQAMALRLEELRLLPRGTYEEITRQGTRSSVDESVVPRSEVQRLGLPARYIELAVSAYDQALISERELARFLATDVVTARAVYQASDVVLDDGARLGVEHAVADLRSGPA